MTILLLPTFKVKMSPWPVEVTNAMELRHQHTKERFQMPECSTTSRSHFTKHRTSSLQISSSMRIKPYLLPLCLAVFFDTCSLNLPTQGISLYIEQIQVKIHPQTFDTWMISKFISSPGLIVPIDSFYISIIRFTISPLWLSLGCGS